MAECNHVQWLTRSRPAHNQHRMRTRSKGDLYVLLDTISCRALTFDSFPLLDLPPELRNHIYELVVSGECIYVSWNFDDGVSRRPLTGDKYTRAITQVCRQTRTESLEIYFHTNTFVFECAQDLHSSYWRNRALSNLRPWLKGRFPCLHYRAAVNEIVVSPNLQQPWTDMGTLLDQLWIIYDFAFREVYALISPEAIAGPLRRAALATQDPPTVSLLDTWISKILDQGAFAREIRLKETDRMRLFDSFSRDRDMVGFFPETWHLRFVPA